MGDENYLGSRDETDGRDPEGKPYFAYGATLRIVGDIPDLEEITQQLARRHS